MRRRDWFVCHRGRIDIVDELLPKYRFYFSITCTLPCCFALSCFFTLSPLLLPPPPLPLLLSLSLCAAQVVTLVEELNVDIDAQLFTFALGPEADTVSKIYSPSDVEVEGGQDLNSP